jgi:exoribonuclease R
MRISIFDRAYKIFVTKEEEIVSEEVFDPIKLKLFDGDDFIIDRITKKSVIVKSITRTSQNLTGILILEDNKTYGRTENKKRLLYKCIPDNKNLPFFLIPYEIKMNFLKKNKNKYILFKYHEWSDKSSHPFGIINETLGDIDNLESLYEYKLHSNFLNISINKLTNNTNISIIELKEKVNSILWVDDKDNVHLKEESNFKVVDYSHLKDESLFIYTIDPEKSIDYDDGVSFQEEDGLYCVTIYLANVFLLIEALKLWNILSEKVSSIYLPDKRRPMLPSQLTKLCSLKENKTRIAIAVKFYFDKNGTHNPELTKIENVKIKVNKNYVYESKNLMICKHYKSLMKLSVILDPKITNSRELIAFWMIYTNTFYANYMIPRKTGIFKKIQTINYEDNSELDKETNGVIRKWNRNMNGSYYIFNEDVIDTKAYIHITSPMRRIVDLLNQIVIHKELYLGMVSDEANIFLSSWGEKMKYINDSMYSIRNVQYECFMMDFCSTVPMIMEEVFEGIILEKEVFFDYYEYFVYLERIKLRCRVKKTEINVENNSKHKFKIIIFKNEETLKRKVRVLFVEDNDSF